jgi:hypothetical protein
MSVPCQPIPARPGNEAERKVTVDLDIDKDAMLDAVAASRLIGLRPATLAKMRCMGGGPEFLKLGRRIVYSRADLLAWLNDRRVSNTTQAAGLPRRLTEASTGVTRG